MEIQLLKEIVKRIKPSPSEAYSFLDAPPRSGTLHKERICDKIKTDNIYNYLMWTNTGKGAILFSTSEARRWKKRITNGTKANLYQHELNANKGPHNVPFTFRFRQTEALAYNLRHLLGSCDGVELDSAEGAIEEMEAAVDGLQHNVRHYSSILHSTRSRWHQRAQVIKQSISNLGLVCRLPAPLPHFDDYLDISDFHISISRGHF